MPIYIDFVVDSEPIGYTGSCLYQRPRSHTCTCRFVYPQINISLPRFKKLDGVFASDVVGDGTTGVIGPFEVEAAQGSTGTVPYSSDDQWWWVHLEMQFRNGHYYSTFEWRSCHLCACP
jgi:hypothetical protein